MFPVISTYYLLLFPIMSISNTSGAFANSTNSAITSGVLLSSIIGKSLLSTILSYFSLPVIDSGLLFTVFSYFLFFVISNSFLSTVFSCFYFLLLVVVFYLLFLVVVFYFLYFLFTLKYYF